MRSLIKHLSFALALGALGPSLVLADPEPPEHNGLIGLSEFYLPGDPDEPVRMYFAQAPLDLTDPNFDAEAYRKSILKAFEDFTAAHAERMELERQAQLERERDPARLRKVSLEKLFGKSIYDADWEVRMENARRNQGVLGEEMVSVEPTPEQRLSKFKMYFSEFAVSEDNYDPVVRRNLEAVRRAIKEGDEDFYYEKLTFKEKIHSTRQFAKDISRKSTDPEIAKNLTKVAGVWIDRGELGTGIFFASYRSLTSATFLLMKGVQPEIAIGITTFQTLITFVHNTYQRHISTMFNANPQFPGFRYNSKWVKWRKDVYYIGVGELTQFFLGGLSWSHLAAKQLRILFQNQLFGSLDHHLNAQPRDMILKGKAKPTKWFNRLSYALITPWTTMDTFELFKGKLIDLRIGTYEIYGIKLSTVGSIGGYVTANQFITKFPKKLERLSDWLERKETGLVTWLMRTKNVMVSRCKRVLRPPGEIEFQTPKPGEPLERPKSTAKQTHPSPEDRF